MRISTAATLALTTLLVTALLGAVAAAQPASTPPAVERSPSPSFALSPASALEPSPSVSTSTAADRPLQTPETRQVIRIRITDTGDAVWTVESRFRITNRSEADAFNDYADAVVSGQRTAPYNPQVFDPMVHRAAEATGRDMTIENSGWDAPRVEQLETGNESTAGDESARVGILAYSFTWTEFATVDGDRIHVGDTFQAAELFQTLDSGQRLIIEPPDNYGFVDAPTGTDDGALVWDGPHQFATDIEITLLRGAGSGISALSGTDWVIVAFLGLVAIVFIGSIYYLIRRDGDADGVFSVEFPLERPDAFAILERDSRTDDGDDRGPTATAEGSQAGTDSMADTPVSESPDSGTRLEFEPDEPIDPELLSDEERVLRLLKENGGRMKQASIVSETGWSNAKVSQLLSKMDDDDEIEKLRIGRENLITLPGVDPTTVE